MRIYGEFHNAGLAHMGYGITLDLPSKEEWRRQLHMDCSAQLITSLSWWDM